MLHDIISAYDASISEAVTEAWAERFTKKAYPKSTIINKAGHKCRHYYFVESGAIRLYQLNGEGEEMVVWITGEQSVFTDLRSFNYDLVSDLTIEALEDCTIHQISREDYFDLLANDISWSNFMLQVWQESFLAISAAVVSFQHSSAGDRYRQLQQDTDIPLRIKQKHIASFLGVTPNALSRLKKNK